MAGDLAIGVRIRGKDNLSGVARKAAGKTASTLSKLEKRFGKANLMNSAVLVAGLYAAQRAFKATLAPAMEFEDALASVKSIAPGTLGSVRADMNAIEDASRGWAKEHADSAAEFVRSSYQMLSAGLNTRQSIAATETALAVASGTMGDANETAQFLATTYNTLGDKTRPVTEEMKRLGDTIVKTQQYFQLPNIQKLTDGMTYATPIAVQYGMSLEQTATVIGQLNTLGLQGSQAGTSFAAAMSKMIPASKKLGFEIARTSDGGVDFIETVKNISKQFEGKMGLPETQVALQKAFGQRGVRAITLMVAKTKDLEKGYAAVMDSAGAMAAAQQTMEATTSSSIQIMKNNLADLSIQFGAVALPLVNDALPKITNAMNGIAENWDVVIAAMTIATSVFLYKTLLPMIVKSLAMISAHPVIALLLGVAVAAKAAAVLVEQDHKRRQREKMKGKEGVVGVYSGAGGARNANKALDEIQARAVAAGGGAPTEADRIATERSIAPPVSAPNIFGGVGSGTEVGGEINISFANAPAGMRVNDVKSTNSNVALGIKGNLGASSVGSGGL